MKGARPTGPALRRLLARKVWRDTMAMGGASLSMVVLIAVGVSLYVLFAEARANLQLSVEQFYINTRFDDATVLVESAPLSLVDAARQVPGVRVAIGRRVKDGALLLRDRPRKRVMGRFIGIVPGQPRPVDDYTVLRGRDLSGRGECLLEQKFAAANRLGPGDLVTGNYLGQEHEFVVAGTVASPEYLYPAPDKESPMGSPETFGVCWVDDDALRAWVGLGQTITEVHALVEPGQADAVVRSLKALGERYGLRSWWTREDQPSNRLLKADLQGWQALSFIFPMLFLFAAALSLYSALNRVIRMQTGVIGFLRASGVSRAEVLWHYVAQGALVTLLGAVPGAVLGHAGSAWMVRLYISVIQTPVVITRPYAEVMLTAALMALAVGVVAAWVPARRAADTPPAIAMRGDSANEVLARAVADSSPWVERLTRHLPVLMRIPARAILSRPSRTALAIGGLASGCAILVMTLGMYTAIMGSISEYLDYMVNYELDVTMSGPQAVKLVDAMGALPGVTAVSHTAAVSVRIKANGQEITCMAAGMEAGQQTMRLKRVDGGFADPKPGELWLAAYVAKRLRVKPGDYLLLEWAYSSRQREVSTVMRLGGLLDITFGGFAIGDLHDLRRRLIDRCYPSAGYGAAIQCSPERGREIRRRLERDATVVNIMSMADVREQIRSSLRITIIFVGIMLGFGAILAGAVLHSISSVGIMERLRELATLRSLGFSARATTSVAALEVYWMAGIGLLVGIPLGYQLNKGFLKSFETDMMSMRPMLPLWTYLLAAGIVFALVSWSLRAGVERLRTMDLAQATKARE